MLEYAMPKLTCGTVTQPRIQDGHILYANIGRMITNNTLYVMWIIEVPTCTQHQQDFTTYSPPVNFTGFNHSIQIGGQIVVERPGTILLNRVDIVQLALGSQKHRQMQVMSCTVKVQLHFRGRTIDSYWTVTL